MDVSTDGLCRWEGSLVVLRHFWFRIYRQQQIAALNGAGVVEPSDACRDVRKGP